MFVLSAGLVSKLIARIAYFLEICIKLPKTLSSGTLGTKYQITRIKCLIKTFTKQDDNENGILDIPSKSSA